ncbi:EamA family transporter [Nakamurella lactea]|uniref:EamA family transporter n=1 Tax=Nakamurella lactea TaxID=459515 RepID=UPI000401D3E8|nr:EamA family transporter [Nakamurella lactea]
MTSVAGSAGPLRRRGIDRAPPAALFVVSGFSQYYGAALAVGLFATLPALGVSWWRIALSAVFLLLWRRPWRSRWTARELGASALFGIVLAAMNLAFYLAIDHLPLGIAVSIEFLGPVAVAAITGRGRRERWGIVLAAAGVVLLAASTLSIGGWSTSIVVGLVAIVVSGACWAGYILLGRRIATRRDGIGSLAVGMTAGALVFVPFGVGSFVAVVTDVRALLLLAGVALFSSVLPYAIEQVVLRRVTAAQFAILLALLPLAAAIVGAVVLHQLPSPWEIVGMALVCIAIALSTDRSTPSETA